MLLWLNLVAAAPAEAAHPWVFPASARQDRKTEVSNKTSSRAAAVLSKAEDNVTTSIVQTSSSRWASITAKAKQHLTYGQDLPAGTSFNASVYSCWTGEPGCLLSVNRWSSCASRWSSWSHTDVNGTSVPYTVSSKSTSVFSYWAGWTSHWDPPGLAGGNFLYATGTPTLITTQVFSDTYTGTQLLVYSTLKPPPNCTWTPWATIPKPNPATCTPCEVQGGTVELLYWADQATASLSSSWPLNLSHPVTAVYKNMTLTSPTVYIDFQTAYATNNCGETVGGTYPGAVIGVLPQSLSSLDGANDVFQQIIDGGASTSIFYQAESFNFHNLAGVVPASVYAAQPSCFALGCYVIYSNGYSPRLMLPTEVRNLDPAWKTCGLAWQGLWDPPKALKPASVIDPVTTPVAASQTVPASPKSAISSVASQTTISDVRSTASPDPGIMHPDIPAHPTQAGPQGTAFSSHIGSATASSRAQASATGLGEPQADQGGVSDSSGTSSTAMHLDPHVSSGTLSTDGSGEIPDVAPNTIASQPPFGSEMSNPIAFAIMSVILAAGSSSWPQTPQAADSTPTITEAVSASSWPSPSNAYQVLSEALGTAVVGAESESSSARATDVQQNTSPGLSTEPHASTPETAPTSRTDSDDGLNSNGPTATMRTASDTVFSYKPQSQSTSYDSSDQISPSSTSGGQASTPQFAAIAFIGSETLTAAAWHAAGSATDAGLTMGGLTLTAGGRAVTSNGHTFSAEETGLVFNGELLPFTEMPISATLKSMSPVGLSTGSVQLTAGQLYGSVYEVGGDDV